MRKILGFLFVFFAFLACFHGYALEFKAGTYYFDNSKLKFDSVKFLVGDSTTTHVFDMEKLQDKEWWSLQLNQNVENVNSYCFLCGNIPDSVYNIPPNIVINNGEYDIQRRTMLFPVDINILPNWVEQNWVFYPLNDSIISNGYWRTISSYDATPSMTLPLLHINTEDSLPITTKDYYLNGTFWIEDEQQALGSEDSPLEIEIKGRGNYTWNFMNKKPYKIRFAKKQSPLGLDESKHFILMASAVDWSGHICNETGFELSRQLGMDYTTRQLPVELMLNGEYMGMYFLCEKIRVENGRVDIMEQEDNDDNPYNVTGGWLLELAYEGNIVIQQYENNDPNNYWISFKANSPELLSQVQYDYIHVFIFSADSCIFVPDKNDTGWEQYLDINTLARFYVIQEVMENEESFSGSLFMFKDWGEDEKLKFGPVWDFDNSFWHMNTTCDHFIFEYETPFPFIWIRELLKFPNFQKKIREVWKEFKDKNVLEKIKCHATQWQAVIAEAVQHDKLRWPYYGSYISDVFLDLISNKVAWLDEQWGVPEGDVNLDGVVTAADVTALYNFMLNGDTTNLVHGDVNGDGNITSGDVTFIYDILLGE